MQKPKIHHDRELTRRAVIVYGKSFAKKTGPINRVLIRQKVDLSKQIVI